MTTLTKRRQPVQRSARLDPPPRDGRPGLLDLTVGKDVFHYYLTPLPSDFGRAFRLEKFAAERRGDGDQDGYDVLLDGQRSSCECRGFLRWGHCKHRDSLLELQDKGQL